MEVRPVDDAGLPAVRSLVDRVFLAGRGRSGSMCSRFPGVLAGAVAAFEGSEPVGVVALRDVALDDGRRHWPVTMAGLVAVRADQRGAGIGGALLAGVRAELEHRGSELGVLWAGRHDLYAAHGWRTADPSVRATLYGEPAAAAPAGIATLDPALAAREQLDVLAALSDHDTPVRVLRGPDRFLAVPPPANRVVIHVADAAAYAAVGVQGADAYVYELAGDPAALPALWDAVLAGHERVTVNGRRDGAAERWLETTRGVRFEAQELALWLPLTPAAEAAPIGGWHIPWLDRI